MIGEMKASSEPNFLEQCLNEFDTLKKRGAFPCNGTSENAPKISRYSKLKNMSSELLASRVGKVVSVGVFWAPLVASTGDLVSSVVELIVDEVSYECGLPGWAIGMSVGTYVTCFGIAVFGTVIVYLNDKRDKILQKKRDEENARQAKAEFIATFDQFKTEIISLIKELESNKKTDLKEEETAPSPSKDKQKETGSEESEERIKQFSDFENAFQECVEKLNVFAKNCEKLPQESQYFSKGLWLSQLIYLFNKAQVAMNGIRDENVEENETGKIKQIVDLTKSISDTDSEEEEIPQTIGQVPELLEKATRSAAIIEEAKKTQQSSEKFFAGEMASSLIFNPDNVEARAKIVMAKTWSFIESFCGPIEYLVGLDGNQFICSDGTTWNNEEEAIQHMDSIKNDKQEPDPDAVLDSVVIDIHEDTARNEDAAYGCAENSV